ncbi:MAG: 50S ribosomal protein L25 [Candidatus Taylorbacteria bacterium]|nr:50S ribosomal protein L25 [Candidatus Taylorbacteria bacterium]
MLTINFEKRDNSQKLEALRKAGLLPAVYYGRKEKSTSVAVKAAEFLKLWKKAGESSIIELKGLSESHQALIKAIDVHPVTGVPRHADFYVVEKDKKLKIKVPVNYVGVSTAVKDLAGILVKVMHEIEIEALPKDLPYSIDADLSLLVALDSQITAKELKMPAGVELKVSPEEVVALIDIAKEEVVEETTAIDMSTIEVAKKGKEAKEGEAPAEGDAKDAPKAEEKKKDKK